MARMRYLKPEFWTDGVITGLSAFARLLYQGTWNFAICDSGHLDDDPVALKLKVLPADDVDIMALLGELFAAGRIVRRTGPDGRTYLQVPTLTRHNKTDPRWSPRCPYCAAEAATGTPPPTPQAQPTTPTLSETPASTPELTPVVNRSGMGVEEEVRPSDVQRARARDRTRDDAEFDRFWAAYPRREAKGAARKAWDKAILRADPDRIVAAAEAFRDQPGREARFTAHPATWLNADRWLDERPPPGAGLAIRDGPNGRPSTRPSTTDQRVQAALDLAAELRQEAQHDP